MCIVYKIKNKKCHIFEGQTTFLDTIFDIEFAKYFQTFCEYFICFQYNLGENADYE